MNDYLIIYLLLCGPLSVIWIYYDLFYSEKKEELQEHVDDACWKCGLDRGTLLGILFLIVFWIGGVLLPVKIFNKIKNFIKDSL